MSEVAKVFEKLKDANMLSERGQSRNFGISLVFIGIAVLVFGIIYHVQFMLGLRMERKEMTAAGLVHGESKFPPSFTLITAVILLLIGLLTISSMLFHFGPFE